MLFVRESKYERVFRPLFDQLVRGATSIRTNVVEGRAGSSKKDWRNFYVIALTSANETKYWLCLVRDTIEINRNKLLISAEG